MHPATTPTKPLSRVSAYFRVDDDSLRLRVLLATERSLLRGVIVDDVARNLGESPERIWDVVEESPLFDVDRSGTVAPSTKGVRALVAIVRRATGRPMPRRKGLRGISREAARVTINHYRESISQ